MINGDGDESASDVLPVAPPVTEDALPAVDNATANEDLVALLF